MDQPNDSIPSQDNAMLECQRSLPNQTKVHRATNSLSIFAAILLQIFVSGFFYEYMTPSTPQADGHTLLIIWGISEGMLLIIAIVAGIRWKNWAFLNALLIAFFITISCCGLFWSICGSTLHDLHNS